MVRRVRGRAEILLGRRAPKNRFMPDVYVFPGGGVQRDDATRPLVSSLRASTRKALAGASRTPSPRAVGAAAIRETHEETGLRLGKLVDGELRPDLSKLTYLARAITPAHQPTRFHARFFVADRDAFAGSVRSNGELLDLRWETLEAARRLPIVDVTEIVLSEVDKYIAGARRTPPLICYRNGKPLRR